MFTEQTRLTQISPWRPRRHRATIGRKLFFFPSRKLWNIEHETTEHSWSLRHRCWQTRGFFFLHRILHLTECSAPFQRERDYGTFVSGAFCVWMFWENSLLTTGFEDNTPATLLMSCPLLTGVWLFIFIVESNSKERERERAKKMLVWIQDSWGFFKKKCSP